MIYQELGKCDLGDLSRIHSYLIENIVPNLYKLNSKSGYQELHCNHTLDDGTDIIAMKYGAEPFYTIKGQSLTHLFDDWQKIQKFVESNVYPHKPQNPFPLISICTSHIFRHKDLKRNLSVNMGLMNVSDSATIFWENGELISFAQYDIGESILANVSVEHSVTINDSPSFRNPRAILMWTIV